MLGFVSKKIYIAIIAVCIAAAAAVYFLYGNNSSNGFSTNCYLSSDCQWVSINCCNETGAYWQCVNKKTYAPVKCPETVICPQLFSPKPAAETCVCKDGGCIFS